jgi:L-serine/L-threonine ammonia-lyase
MSLVAQQAKKKSPDAHLIIASGGNAGFAAACAARAVGIRCTVFLPAGLDSHFLDSLQREGAEIVAGGKDYSEVLLKAQEAQAQNDRRYVRTLPIDSIFSNLQHTSFGIWYFVSITHSM